MVPSLHINLPSDVHLAIPPFLPEQGLLPFAITSVVIQKDKSINTTVTTLRITSPLNKKRPVNPGRKKSQQITEFRMSMAQDLKSVAHVYRV